MSRNLFILLAAAFALAACETPTTQRYAISADNNQSIKALGTTGIGLSTFTGPATFNSTCRALGPLQVADGMTHTAYIRKAFEDELKVAGAFAQSTARVTLGANIDRLEFSTTRGLTGGSWSIDMTMKSSNGRTLQISEYYEFDSGFVANEACRNTADAYSRSVQNLVGKAVRSAGFPLLIQ